jgi:hypothetical protein
MRYNPPIPMGRLLPVSELEPNPESPLGARIESSGVLTVFNIFRLAFLAHPAALPFKTT